MQSNDVDAFSNLSNLAKKCHSHDRVSQQWISRSTSILILLLPQIQHSTRLLSELMFLETIVRWKFPYCLFPLYFWSERVNFLLTLSTSQSKSAEYVCQKWVASLSIWIILLYYLWDYRPYVRVTFEKALQGNQRMDPILYMKDKSLSFHKGLV